MHRDGRQHADPGRVGRPVALGVWWRGNPWSWTAPLVLAAVGTLALARPVCEMVRVLVARWTTTVIPGGYRRALAPVALRFLRPSRAMALTDRVGELTAQRADTTIAQAAEIRRIERDLHDGAQARLVSLGLSLATAERRPALVDAVAPCEHEMLGVTFRCPLYMVFV